VCARRIFRVLETGIPPDIGYADGGQCGRRIAERFPVLRARLRAQVYRALPTPTGSRLSCLRRYRGARQEAEKNPYKAPLLLSVNCIAAGFGSTG